MATLKTLFTGPKKPKVEPVRMPSADDRTLVEFQQRKKAAERSATEGRQSTNLTGDYSGTILGS